MDKIIIDNFECVYLKDFYAYEKIQNLSRKMSFHIILLYDIDNTENRKKDEIFETKLKEEKLLKIIEMQIQYGNYCIEKVNSKDKYLQLVKYDNKIKSWIKIIEIRVLNINDEIYSLVDIYNSSKIVGGWRNIKEYIESTCY